MDTTSQRTIGVSLPIFPDYPDGRSLGGVPPIGRPGRPLTPSSSENCRVFRQVAQVHRKRAGSIDMEARIGVPVARGGQS
jgi:hypothetical protein